MTDFSIRAEHLSKLYKLGTELQNRTAFDVIRNAWGRMRGTHTSSEKADFWALDDVSFTVQKGEVLGIIGRNGSGKSTLLKILSRITAPTQGRAQIDGRVASLLEVGTGFHPEMTGRENIFVNGTILGMKRQEIARKFDEIVEFADVARFIDTPVKRYSSGMYVRLAFAVAAHLESEILLVDEVLAVGDATFQKKSLGKMQSLGNEGRTVVFVSHNMQTMLRLCNRLILLQDGHLMADGTPYQVVEQYLTSSSGTMAHRKWEPDKAPQSADGVRLDEVGIYNRDGEVSDTFDVQDSVTIRVTYSVGQRPFQLTAAVLLTNAEALPIFMTLDTSDEAQQTRTQGQYCAELELPANFLAEGQYTVTTSLTTDLPSRLVHLLERDAVVFRVIDENRPGGTRGYYAGSFIGVIRPKLPWTTTPR